MLCLKLIIIFLRCKDKLVCSIAHNICVVQMASLLLTLWQHLWTMKKNDLNNI